MSIRTYLGKKWSSLSANPMNDIKDVSSILHKVSFMVIHIKVEEVGEVITFFVNLNHRCCILCVFRVVMGLKTPLKMWVQDHQFINLHVLMFSSMFSEIRIPLNGCILRWTLQFSLRRSSSLTLTPSTENLKKLTSSSSTSLGMTMTFMVCNYFDPDDKMIR